MDTIHFEGTVYFWEKLCWITLSVLRYFTRLWGAGVIREKVKASVADKFLHLISTSKQCSSYFKSFDVFQEFEVDGHPDLRQLYQLKSGKLPCVKQNSNNAYKEIT